MNRTLTNFSLEFPDCQFTVRADQFFFSVIWAEIYIQTAFLEFASLFVLSCARMYLQSAKELMSGMVTAY